MTVLATSDDALLLAASVLLRWCEGFVEPTVPPPLPLHLLGQQLLALALQEGQIGRHTWQGWYGQPLVLGEDVEAHAEMVIEHLIAQGYLVDVGDGMLVIGQAAERDYGHRHFMELLAVFTAPPLFSVRHGRTEVGLVPDEALFVRPPGGDRGPTVLLLAGKGWHVLSVDWRRRVIQVEPTDQPGVARWNGGSARLGAELARGVRDVLTGSEPSGVTLSRRAVDQLDEVRDTYRWARADRTILVNDGRVRWWTFAGQHANTWLASLLPDLRTEVTAFDGLSVALDSTVDLARLGDALQAVDAGEASLAGWISEEAVENLKFSDCVPPGGLVLEIASRVRDDASVARAISEQRSSFLAR
jgi:ATP-dependent Lhr-like helicase